MMAGDLARALEGAGLAPDAAATGAARFQAVIGRLARGRPDARDACHAWFVPGRIEVLGKHTDYGGGRSLICAAERGFHAAAAPRPDRRVALHDVGRETSLVLDPDGPLPDVSWGTYPMTVLRRLTRNFVELRRGVDLVFESTLPSAAGMSSSSALMIAVLLALVRANGLDGSDTWTANVRDMREDLAAYAASIENGRSFRGLAGERGVGTEGGSEDHTAILCSRPGYLAQYAFCPTRRERSIALSAELTFVIGVSGVAARKTGEAREDYNRAARNAQRALDRWRADTGRGDETLAAAVASSADAAARLRHLLADDAELADRFEQFVEESTVLVPSAADHLASGALDAFGRVAARSQDLAERLLRNQVPETISLARLAREQGALAASAFGAGFGGSVWALAELADAPALLDRWQQAYRAAWPAAAPRSRFFVTRPGPGVITLG
jgi:galactokinase